LPTYDLGIKLLEYYGTYAGFHEGIVGVRVGGTRRIVLPPFSVSTFVFLLMIIVFYIDS